MKITIATSLLGLMLVVPVARAQNAAEALRWGSDLKQATDEAQKTNRPLMLWVIKSSDRKENSGENMERDQKRAFADARVVELSKRFVLSKMSVSRYKDDLAKMGVRAGASFDILFATPSGEVLDQLDPGGATKPESLAAKMASASRTWRDKVYADKLKAIIEGDKAPAKDVKSALDTVEDLNILSADQSLIALIDKQGVDEGVQTKAIEVLGKLSTKAGVAVLLQRAASDPRAEKALNSSLPNVADELMLDVGSEDSGKHLTAYTALCKVCKISNIKPAKFWDGKNQKVKTDEINRVKDLATKAAAKWRQRNEEYR